jgi:nondiscriminating glutamyl-tRNA synthetase
MVKTRFAASPTGFLHIGGLRTALFSYLFAKKNGGQFLVRIEDTDRERFVEGGVKNILYSLQWAGLNADEGLKLEADNKNITHIGDNGPYIQSERLEIYKKHINNLLNGGNAYHCFCTKERLEDLRKKQEESKMPPGYDGHCSNLSKEEVEKKKNSGEEYVIRMRMPKEGVTEIDDLVRGKVKFENSIIDDQVILKSDGFPTYHFAVVVDDHLMGITHVIRGEEWLPSTPKHINLYKMFNWDLPQYAHLSLLVNEQKQKLSKRHGDVAVADFRSKGYLPEGIINFIALLGWNPGTEREFYSLKDLEKEFSIERVGKAAAVFNLEKLDWFNNYYIKEMDIDKLTELSIPYIINSGLAKESELNNGFLTKVLLLVKDRLNNLSDIADVADFLFAGRLEYEPALLVWKKSDTKDAKEKLKLLSNFLSDIESDNWTKEKLEEEILKWIKSNDFEIGNVLWPMRVALSGKKNSPGPFEIAEVLGKGKVLNRLSDAHSKI